MGSKVDPVTLEVVRGSLESITRQMTITMDRTSRSPILKLAHDYSNAIFDWIPRGRRRVVVLDWWWVRHVGRQKVSGNPPCQTQPPGFWSAIE